MVTLSQIYYRLFLLLIVTLASRLQTLQSLYPLKLVAFPSASGNKHHSILHALSRLRGRSFLTENVVFSVQHLALLSSSFPAQIAHPTVCCNTTGVLTLSWSHQRGRLSPQLFIIQGNTLIKQVCSKPGGEGRKLPTYLHRWKQISQLILESTSLEWGKQVPEGTDCYFQQTKHIPFLCCWTHFSETTDIMQTSYKPRGQKCSTAAPGSINKIASKP